MASISHSLETVRCTSKESIAQQVRPSCTQISLLMHLCIGRYQGFVCVQMSFREESPTEFHFRSYNVELFCCMFLEPRWFSLTYTQVPVAAGLIAKDGTQPHSSVGGSSRVPALQCRLDTKYASKTTSGGKQAHKLLSHVSAQQLYCYNPEFSSFSQIKSCI